MPAAYDLYPTATERMFPTPGGGRRFRGHHPSSGVDGTAEEHGGPMTASIPTTTVTLEVPVDLELAGDLVKTARGASPALATLTAQVARAIVRAHEGQPFMRLDSATIALNSPATSTG